MLQKGAMEFDKKLLEFMKLRAAKDKIKISEEDLRGFISSPLFFEAFSQYLGISPDISAESPELIEKASLNYIENVLDFFHLSQPQKTIVARAVHATADFSIVPFFHFSRDFFTAFESFLKNGGKIFVDTRMALSGISKGFKDLGVSIVYDEPEEKPSSMTKSAFMFRRIGKKLGGNGVLIANAPTALLEVLKLYREGIKPAFIVGVPVGFVEAKRSKRLLVESGIPCITLLSDRGGTPIGVSILNALLRLYS